MSSWPSHLGRYPPPWTCLPRICTLQDHQYTQTRIALTGRQKVAMQGCTVNCCPQGKCMLGESLHHMLLHQRAPQM